MPPEYYLGASIVVIIIVLVALLFRRRPVSRRRHDLQKSSGTDQLADQLSRIADALEALVVHFVLRLPMSKNRPYRCRKLPN